MLFKYLLPGLLTTTAVAVPVADSDENIMHFKRDDVLKSRDLELANIHGVNLTDSKTLIALISITLGKNANPMPLPTVYKHSMFKRADGDHVIIWVARSFIDHQEEQGSLDKRQGARPGRESGFNSDALFSDLCHDHRRQNHAGPNGPYSGGVQAMYRWARAHRGGAWPVRSNWENLVIAGSNNGANAVYKARVVRGGSSSIGTQDVRNDADWTQNRAREFSGRGWRASSKGGETCALGQRINYEIVRTDLRY